MRKHKSFSVLPMLLLCVGLVFLPRVVMGGANPTLQMFGGVSGERSLEMKQSLQDILSLVVFSCKMVYPQPTFAECVDRVKHGVGTAFDPHSEYMSKEEFKLFEEGAQGAFGGVGMAIRKNSPTSPVIVVNVLEDTPSARVGLLAGDVISHIVGSGNVSIPTSSLKSSADAVKLLRGTPDTTVSIRVVRKGVDKPMNFTIKREVIKSVQIKGDLIQDGEKTYALIENKQFLMRNRDAFRDKYLELAKRAGGKLSGLIIRLENNPGGQLDEAYGNTELFLGEQESIILLKSNDGIEVYTPRRGPFAQPVDITNGLPILVVVNGGSASASELFSGAMKHFGRAVIAGTSRTYGKGIVQTVYPPDFLAGAAVKLTSSEYLIGSTTDWIPVQCIGVEPDILFEYPGIKNPTRPTECDQSEHVNTGGPMANPPVHRPIKDANPELYKAGVTMLEAYKAHMLPKLLAEEEKRKQLEAQ
ncbi:MAG: Carboxy-terminal protease [Candidatus Giovannonibacteria bacterium GW2011_GWA2_53_7]|uniref:Carboxy-terminal protease n=1 Tax=Candidatus Giovannonibacteria bacterium GW2011_GWA2_53_7 TaxID=1618650 RepID=A0A0G1Y0I0_9BACT|nr:MAG: Carboxy-terminal protease [Candidatus Giovannonibacteria bacterium GW2011_GWA2_53_7]